MINLDVRECEKLIENLYNIILKRKADPNGLVYHTNYLMNLGVEKGYAEIIKIFLESKEYENLLETKYKQDNQNEILKKIFWNKDPQKKEVLNHLISLGDHCLTSFLIKKYGYKHYSLPFDWLFSNIDAIMHCLNDDFKVFLDRNYHESTVTVDSKQATFHHFYEDNFGVNAPMFNHADITQLDQYQYTERTIQRFRKLLDLDDPKLFIHIAKPENRVRDQFSKVIEILNEKTKNFKLLFIQLENPTEKENDFSLKLIENIEGNKFYSFQSNNIENGIEFVDSFDDLVFINLLNDYDLIMKNI